MWRQFPIGIHDSGFLGRSVPLAGDDISAMRLLTLLFVNLRDSSA